MYNTAQGGDILDKFVCKQHICVEFLSHNIIMLQLVKIGILFMLSFIGQANQAWIINIL